MNMSIAREFLELKSHWNRDVDQFSDYYTHAGSTVGCKWSEWLKSDDNFIDVYGNSNWSVLGVVTRPVETKNLLACHKTHAGHVKRVLPRCIKAAHRVDIHDEEQLKRYTHFLKCARDIGAHPNFLTVEGVFVGNPNNREDMSKYYIITEAPCMSLGKRWGRIIFARHLISPPIVDEIVRELLSAVEFLHFKDIVHHSISNDTIVCKTQQSLVPIALVDIDYCGSEQFVWGQKGTARYPYCSQESYMPRREWVYYRRTEQIPGKFVSGVDDHYIAPEIVKNRIQAQCNTGYSKGFEDVGPPADIYQLGVAIWELIGNNSPGYKISTNHCLIHKRAETRSQQFERRAYLKTITQYDLRNCYKCQVSYVNNTKLLSNNLAMAHDTVDILNSEKFYSLQYYGRKYFNLVRTTLNFEQGHRSTAQRLLKEWESQLRGPGGQAIKDACTKRSPCVTAVYENRDVIYKDFDLLIFRERQASLRGVPVMTNDIIRDCFIDKGYSGELTREHGLLMMEHIYHQIVEDDEFSDVHGRKKDQ